MGFLLFYFHTIQTHLNSQIVLLFRSCNTGARAYKLLLLRSADLPALASLQNITMMFFFKWCWTQKICASMSHIFAPCIITSIPNLPLTPPRLLGELFLCSFGSLITLHLSCYKDVQRQRHLPSNFHFSSNCPTPSLSRHTNGGNDQSWIV